MDSSFFAYKKQIYELATKFGEKDISREVSKLPNDNRGLIRLRELDLILAKRLKQSKENSKYDKKLGMVSSDLVDRIAARSRRITDENFEMISQQYLGFARKMNDKELIDKLLNVSNPDDLPTLGFDLEERARHRETLNPKGFEQRRKELINMAEFFNRREYIPTLQKISYENFETTDRKLMIEIRNELDDLFDESLRDLMYIAESRELTDLFDELYDLSNTPEGRKRRDQIAEELESEEYGYNSSYDSRSDSEHF